MTQFKILAKSLRDAAEAMERLGEELQSLERRQYVTKAEAAEILSRDPRTIRSYIPQGLIPCSDTGFIPMEAIQAFAEKGIRRVETAARPRYKTRAQREAMAK